jgi:hypothetical protein
MRGTCTPALSRPEWPSVCSADQSYSPKMRMVLSKLSRSDEQALNIESKGSDRLELRTRLDCPLANSNCSQSVIRGHWPRAIRSANGSSGLEGLCREQQPLGFSVLACATRLRELTATQPQPQPQPQLSSVQGPTKLRAPLRSPRCQHAPVASDALAV